MSWALLFSLPFEPQFFSGFNISCIYYCSYSTPVCVSISYKWMTLQHNSPVRYKCFCISIWRMENRWVMKWFARGHIKVWQKRFKNFSRHCAFPFTKPAHTLSTEKWDHYIHHLSDLQKNPPNLKKIICSLFWKKKKCSGHQWSVFNCIVSGKIVQHPFLYLPAPKY